MEGSGTPPKKRQKLSRMLPQRPNDAAVALEPNSTMDSPDHFERLWNSLLRRHLLLGKDKRRVLSFTPAVHERCVDWFQKELSETVLRAKSSRVPPPHKSRPRHIPASPERCLDAPGLIDDFYLNLIDWSRDNVLAVALGNAVYLWDGKNKQVTPLMRVQEMGNVVTSLSWGQRGNMLAVGTNTGEIQLWDTTRGMALSKSWGHASRVGALAWNESLLSSGSSSGTLVHSDCRVAPLHISTSKEGHAGEICGLKWSPDGTQLASGGNDNLLKLWDASKAVPRIERNHDAAVKALAWSPFKRSLLASGGGAADGTVRTWNTCTGEQLSCVKTGSQVTSVLWSLNRRENQLVSSHGFRSREATELTVWNYPSMTKLAELQTGTSSSRVLQLVQSPDGATVVSVAADETLRFWRVFSPADQPRRPQSCHTIR